MKQQMQNEVIIEEDNEEVSPPTQKRWDRRRLVLSSQTGIEQLSKELENETNNSN